MLSARDDQVLQPSLAGYEPDITIIVTTKNNPRTILDSVRSILDLNYPKEKLRVLVVDASEDLSTQSLLQGMPIDFVRFKANAPAAYNFALRSVRSELVGFIDGDAKVDPDWLREVVKQVGDDAVAGAGGPILTWNKESLVPRAIGYELESRYNNPRNVVRCSTTNLVLKRTVLEEVGGFDDTLDTGYDGDIGYRIVKRGYKIVFEKDAIVFHSHRSTLSSYWKQQYTYAKNDARLYSKSAGLFFSDNVTRKWMAIQPALLSCFVVMSIVLVVFYVRDSSISGFFPRNMAYMWAAIGLFLTLSFLFSSVKIAVSARDPWALPVIFFIFVSRSFAWTTGGVVGLARRAFLQDR